MATTNEKPPASNPSHAGRAPMIDDNGVQEHAASAVDAAASSSGQPLPGELQRKFESSLGTDLSGVRIHTGTASVAACDAVSAQAYAVGNDIHFNEGRFDPASSSGQELIAHEVAHTVQQSGAPAAPQRKLEVSAPGDAHELEADRAAAAMARGEPASVGPGLGLQRRIDRDPLPEEMRENAVEVEKQDNARPVSNGGVTTVGTASEAELQLSIVDGATKNLETALKEGDGSYEQVQANDAAGRELREYIAELSVQESSLGTFVQQFSQLTADSDRLSIQIGTLNGSDAVQGLIPTRDPRATPAAIGNAIVEAGAGATVGELNTEFKKVSGSGDVKGDANRAHEKKTEMNNVAASLKQKELTVTAQGQLVSSALARIDAAKGAVRIAALDSKITTLGSKVGGTKEAVKSMLSDTKAVISGLKVAADAASLNIASLVVDIGTAIFDLVAAANAAAPNDELNKLNEEKTKAERTRVMTEMTSANQQLAGHGNLLQVAQDDFYKTAQELVRTKREYREAMEELGSDTDTASGGGTSYAIVAQILGEGEVYLAQSQVAIDAADLEQRQGEVGRKRVQQLNRTSYFYAQRAFIPGASHTQSRVPFQITPATIMFQPGGPGFAAGATEGARGVNPLMTKMIASLKGDRTKIEEMMGPLRKVFERERNKGGAL